MILQALRFIFIVMLSVTVSHFQANANVIKSCDRDSLSAMQYTFAKYLMDSGDYYRAITEFKRHIYFYPESDYFNQAYYNIGLSFFLANRNIDVINWYLELPENLSNNNRYKVLVGRAYMKNEDYTSAIPYFIDIIQSENQSRLRDHASYRAGISAIRIEDFKMARSFFADVSEHSPFYTKSQHYKTLITDDPYRLKNPSLAGCLGIIPGLGYLYASHTKTAIASFVVIGLLMWATYNAFDDNRNAEGFIISIFSLGFYVGSITGSVQSAYRYNEYVKHRYQTQFEE